jgi:hypothetical protein
MSTTQQNLPIEDIRDNLVFLKSGGVVQVIETTAVNFGLLFETEQVGIIDSFAGLLNSLSFPIQIVVRSQKLDVSSYLGVIDKALVGQTNPLIKNLGLKYRQFVAELIKENEVLDKRFYVVLSAAALEMGLGNKSIEDRTQKATTLLKPRVDHITRQLARIGLKAKIMNNTELIKLFYDFYNSEGLVEAPPPPNSEVTAIKTNTAPDAPPAKLSHLPTPQAVENKTIPVSTPNINAGASLPPSAPVAQPAVVVASPSTSTDKPTDLSHPAVAPQNTSNSHSPFVVEELHEELPN